MALIFIYKKRPRKNLVNAQPSIDLMVATGYIGINLAAGEMAYDGTLPIITTYNFHTNVAHKACI